MTVPDDTAARFQRGLLEWAEENTRSFHWREPARTRYEMLIAEFFLARTRAGVVADIYEDFLEEYPTLEALETAERDRLVDLIRPMGLQNRRGDALLELAETLDGEVPSDVDALLELPRVGPYVAHATLCFGDGAQLPIVDRNVDRVYRRVFADTWESLDDEGQWAFAAELLPEGKARRFNLALLDFASITCTARSPDCGSCFANGYCEYYAREMENP
ncbi:MAG: A/G-specific adenine glycosylase [Haloarculaceae archaeon]